MEVEEVLCDLLALRQLYWLLKTISQNDTTSSEIVPVGKQLDERARLLFKDLLDNSTKRVLELRSKILTIQSDVSHKLCSFQSERPSIGIPRLRPPVSPVVLKSPPGLVSQKDKQPSIKNLLTQETVSQHSKLDEGRKRCSACSRRSSNETNMFNKRITIGNRDGIHQSEQQDGLKGKEKSAEWLKSDGKAKQKTNIEIHRNQSKDGLFFNNRQRERNPQETAIDDFSREISIAIKQIESHILALQLRSKSRGCHGLGKADLVDISPEKLINAGESVQCGNGVLSQLGDNRPSSRPQHRVPSRRQSLREGLFLGPHGRVIDSLNQSASHVNQSPKFVNGLRVPSIQDDLGRASLMDPTHITEEKQAEKMQSNKPPRFVRSTTSNLSRILVREKTDKLPRQMSMRPTLLDHSFGKVTVSPNWDSDQSDRITRRTNMMTHVNSHDRNIPPLHQEPAESTSSSASSSSNWTTQQSGTSSNETESYSLPQHQKGPTHLIQRENNTNSYESRSRENRPYIRRQTRHNKRCILDNQKRHEKVIEQFRRLKNKLGLIFHHHHHHHHHCGDVDDSDMSGHHGYMWNIFRRGETNYDRGKNGKKSLVKKVPRKNQVGHFHALAEGLLRHVWKSRKSKTSKGAIGRLRRGTRGHKKKVHWWQMLRRRRGVKLSSKGRRGVRVGFVNKRQRLKLI